jgi:hypothetical protein
MFKKIIFTAALLSLFFYKVTGQIYILPGTSFIIDSGSTVFVDNLSPDTIKIAPGAQVINDGRIQLSSYTTLNEQAGSPIKGKGYEDYTSFYGDSLMGVEPGGLGLEISTGTAPDSFIIKRYHEPLKNGNVNGIARNYKVLSKINSGLKASITFNYDYTELNGIAPDQLLIYQSDDEGINWYPFQGNAFNYYVRSAPYVVNNLQLISLFPPDKITTVDNPLMEGLVMIYPNPASENICLKGEAMKKIFIRNIIGQVVKEYSASSASFVSIAITDLLPAHYFIEIQTDKGVCYKSFIKL